MYILTKISLATIISISLFFHSPIPIVPDPIIEPLAVLRPALVPVCSCESEQGKYGIPKHFLEDGVTVRMGHINPLDTGMCQINQKYHLATAQKMGLDIFTEQGNIKYANYLYDTQGLAPWTWSKSCWQ